MVPDLCNLLFSIVTLINLVHTYNFHKGFCTVFFSDNKHTTMTLPHSAQRKHALLVKTKEKSKSQKKINKKRASLGLLYQRLGHISKRSLLDGGNANIWQDIDLRVYPYPFCTSCQISTINKKVISKKPLRSKITFKSLFMNITPDKSPKILTKDSTFSNYLLIVDNYHNIKKLYGMENID